MHFLLALSVYGVLFFLVILFSYRIINREKIEAVVEPVVESVYAPDANLAMMGLSQQLEAEMYGLPACETGDLIVHESDKPSSTKLKARIANQALKYDKKTNTYKWVSLKKAKKKSKKKPKKKSKKSK